jgi:hypothetical protein
MGGGWSSGFRWKEQIEGGMGMLGRGFVRTVRGVALLLRGRGTRQGLDRAVDSGW